MDLQRAATTTFPLIDLQSLHKTAATLAKPSRDTPTGWSKSTVDPMAVLAVFESLWIKDGFVLRAYQYSDTDGHGIVLAMPADAEFPEPNPRPPLNPLDTLDDVMEAIDGDHSPQSYLCTSLLCRELREFGAIWHRCDWGTHTILGENPFKTKKRVLGETHSCDPRGWKWHEPEPTEWRPLVTEEKNDFSVTFFTYSGLGQNTVYRHEDTFRRGSYCFTSSRKTIATGGGGYIF